MAGVPVEPWPVRSCSMQDLRVLSIAVGGSIWTSRECRFAYISVSSTENDIQ